MTPPLHPPPQPTHPIIIIIKIIVSQSGRLRDMVLGSLGYH
jgi:hypothetical protein